LGARRRQPRLQRATTAADPLTLPDGSALARRGVVARLTTTGRLSGSPRFVDVGFIEDADGAILVAATDPEAAWARNLEADPRLTIELGDRTFAAVAERLDTVEHQGVVRDLILKYGTPSEGLGRGPSYRLRPADEPA
jgi:deazaflavin-dependent oxidoreductase (nitroreductase family)